MAFCPDCDNDPQYVCAYCDLRLCYVHMQQHTRDRCLAQTLEHYHRNQVPVLDAGE